MVKAPLILIQKYLKKTDVLELWQQRLIRMRPIVKRYAMVKNIGLIWLTIYHLQKQLVPIIATVTNGQQQIVNLLLRKVKLRLLVLILVRIVFQEKLLTWQGH